MAVFRVEFVKDPQSGKVAGELYYPPEAPQALVRTRSIYPSEKDALLGVVNLFKDALEGGRGSTAAVDLSLPSADKK